ncbi:MAG: hypothetical protein AAGA54_36065 [Myxococcota bacterium]
MRVIGWTFPVLVRGDPGAGGPATLTVEWRLSEDITPEDLKTRADQLACVGTWWCKLVDAGGGGGDTIPPDQCAATLSAQDPERLPNRLTWSLETLRVDPRALTILFNLVLMAGLTVTGVSLRCSGGDIELTLSPEDQPLMWPRIPFSLRLELTDRNPNIELEFGQDIPAALRDTVEETLQIWALVGNLGGFRNAVPSEERSQITPTDDVHFEFDLVVLPVRDFGAHTVAYDVLTNLAVKLASSVLPVRSLEIA